MSLSPGQILNNRYRIVKLLGQGGFGAVYRAWDMNLDRPRAVKENLDTSPEVQRQFKREAQILSDLTHPNLPKVIDHFDISGQGQYLVMEYIDGQDLLEMLLTSSGSLPERQVVEWISQVCDALTYLHSQNPPVIHRDIKPANIRITPSGKAMLVDFGIAKVYDPNLKTTLGARAVTPGYSPPEQYGMGTTDARSDVYALGATMYHLLTGLEPSASVDIVSGNVAKSPPAYIHNPQVSSWGSAAVERAMQVDRLARFASIAEFKAALYPSVVTTPPIAQTEVVVSPVIPTPQVPIVTPFSAPATAVSPGRGDSRRLWTAAAGVVLLVIAALVVMGLWRGWGTAVERGVGDAMTQTAADVLLITPEATLLPATLPVDVISTPSPSATLIPPTATPEPTLTQVFLLPTSTVTPVTLLRWKSTTFFEVKFSSICFSPDVICWRGISEGRENDLRMVSQEAVYVDPQWSSVYLVFWHKYAIDSDLYAEVIIGIGSDVHTLRKYLTGSRGWYQDALDLQAYKGQKIVVEFFAKDGEIPSWLLTEMYKKKTVSWTLQDIQIVPDFTPILTPTP